MPRKRFQWLPLVAVLALAFLCVITVPVETWSAGADPGTWMTSTLRSGRTLSIWMREPQNAAVIDRVCSQLDAQTSDVLTTGEPVTDLAILWADDLGALTAANQSYLQQLAQRGVPILCEGSETALTEILGLYPVDITTPQVHEIFVLKMQGARTLRSHFLMPDRIGNVTTRYEKDTETVVGSEEAPPPQLEQARELLLGAAVEWSLQPQEVDRVLTEDPGSWTSIPALYEEWTTVYPNCCPWDYSVRGNVFTVRADFYKVPDGHTDQDYYLAYVTSHHEANKDVGYVSSIGYCDGGWVGWWADSRSLKIQSLNTGDTELWGYSPTGTVSGETVSLSVGADLNTGAAGINAGFTTSYYNSDVTVYDHSSKIDDYADWQEAFLGARYMSGPCPLCVWNYRQPSAVARTSFESKRLALYQSADVYTGTRMRIDSYAKFKKEKVEWDVCVIADVFTVTTYYSEASPYRIIQLLWNYPPDAPGIPSVPTPLWVNDAIAIDATPANDRDGDGLVYSFDFGDGTVGPYGSVSQSHAWTTPGEIRVRSRARDIHGAESNWSGYAQVLVKGLDHVTIQGPAEVPELTGVQLSCTAHFNDGASSDCTAASQWSVASQYATISSSGYLTALDGDGQDRLVTVTATYLNHGVSQSTSHYVWLRDTDYDGDCLANTVDPFPRDADADDDGIPDGSCSPGEDANNNGVVDPGETDPTNADTDGDGILDGTEVGLAAPLRPDATDMNVFVADLDPSTQTDPTKADTDGDGLLDGVEDANHNGKIDEGEPDPSDADTDDDGVVDGEDRTLLSNLEPYVVINGCDSAVENHLLEGGQSINDRIAECASQATNHGEFVSCVADLCNDLVQQRILTGKEMGRIQSCAAHASFPIVVGTPEPLQLGIVLWPPNHEYVTVDPESCLADGDMLPVGMQVVSVTSDEPENANGVGDGDTMDDIVIECPNTVRLRAERDGNGNGRVYTVTFAFIDSVGVEQLVECHVQVPRDAAQDVAVEGPGPGYSVEPDCDVNVALVKRGSGSAPEVQSVPVQVVSGPDAGVAIHLALVQPGDVEVEIFNVAGRLVRKWHLARVSGSEVVRWDGLDQSNREVARGMYLIRAQVEGRTYHSKVIWTR